MPWPVYSHSYRSSGLSIEPIIWYLLLDHGSDPEFSPVRLICLKEAFDSLCHRAPNGLCMDDDILNTVFV